MSPSVQSSILTVCYMDDMSGRKFEEFCQKIFTIRGNGDNVELTPAVNDGGKDLIIHQGGDKVFAECRHEPNIAQGTPDVRSLYAAVVSEGAKSGIFVTTGRFSPQAVRYASNLVPRIKLVDRKKLIGMAEEAGYKLIFGDEEVDKTVYCYREADADEVRSKLQKLMLARLQSKGSDEKISPLGGSLLVWYEPFYRLGLVLPEEDDCPFPRAQGTKFISMSAWVEARYPAEGGPDDPRASIYSDKPNDASVDHPLKELHRWDPDVARDQGIMYLDFRLTFEEAQVIGSRYAKQLAKNRGLPEDSVSVHRVYAVMMPVYLLVAETYHKTREVAAIYTKGPIVLPRDGLVRD